MSGDITLDVFKTYVADVNSGIHGRKLYESPIKGAVSNVFFAAACNKPIAYQVAQQASNGGARSSMSPPTNEYDLCFHRRCFFVVLYNTFNTTTLNPTFDINDIATSAHIARGMLQYLIDVLRAFDIPHLPQSAMHVSSTRVDCWAPQTIRLLNTCKTHTIHSVNWIC